jgi:hypothetical protein
VPILTINAEMAIHEDGAAVHLFVDGARLKRIGPFSSPDEALRAAQRIVDEVARNALPTLHATMAADVSDEAFALMGQK